ncbi:MAG: GIY-YIG nuclease [Candidatus Melainabacteria bacterium HGW-Melainabacteria-1]|nr:MAG: GIY-YIG nuclease [Candidatus Melainabacteria bacterium HGW-Melainabacteria-1]
MWPKTEDASNWLVPGFTSRDGVCRLVWYEQHVDVREALNREKQLKIWNCAWKVSLNQAHHLEWEDFGILASIEGFKP